MTNDIWKSIIENELLKVQYEKKCQEHTFPAKMTILKAGDIAQHFYFIKQGCIRLWFNQDGKDVTSWSSTKRRTPSWRKICQRYGKL